MRRITFLFMLVAVTCWSGPSISRAAPSSTTNVGNWHLTSYADDKTGAFTHCAALTQVSSGMRLAIMHLASDAIALGLEYPLWHLRTGRTSQINVSFDGQAQLSLLGAAASPRLVVFVLSSSALERMSKARMMTAVVSKQSYDLELSSVPDVLAALKTCAGKAKSGGVASAALPAPEAKPINAEPGTEPAPGAPDRAGRPERERAVNVSGTGFVVSTSGYVVTNDHVIKDCVGKISGSLPSGKEMTMRVASTDQLNDLALLQAPTTFPETAVIRAVAIRSGEPVIAIGFPYHGLLTSDFTVTTGIVSSLSGILNDTRYLQTSAPIQPGNSGGPLLDTSGAIAGVAAAKLNALKFAGMSGGTIPENINFAIKTGALRDFLDNSAVPYKTADPAAPALKTDEVAAKARAYTMLIACKAKATAKE